MRKNKTIIERKKKIRKIKPIKRQPVNDDFDDEDEMFGGCGIDESLLFFNGQMFTMNSGL